VQTAVWGGHYLSALRIHHPSSFRATIKTKTSDIQ
jgi:hypothetical protein